jgi:hypothetical protein
VWFTPAFGGSVANRCLLYYEHSSNLLRLIDDAGTAWLPGTPGTAGTLQNSQCSINVGATTVVSSGNNVTLSIPMTFTPSFAGAKQVWMYALGSTASSGWQQRGTWTVQ